MKKLLFGILFLMAIFAGFSIEYDGWYSGIMANTEEVYIEGDMFFNRVSGFRTRLLYLYETEKMILFDVGNTGLKLAFIDGEAGDVTMIMFGVAANNDIYVFFKPSPEDTDTIEESEDPEYDEEL